MKSIVLDNNDTALKSTALIDAEGNLIMKYEQDSQTSINSFNNIKDTVDNKGYVSGEKELQYAGHLPLHTVNEWYIDWFNKTGDINIPQEEFERRIRLFLQENSYLRIANI